MSRRRGNVLTGLLVVLLIDVAFICLGLLVARLA